MPSKGDRGRNSNSNTSVTYGIIIVESIIIIALSRIVVGHAIFIMVKNAIMVILIVSVNS